MNKQAADFILILSYIILLFPNASCAFTSVTFSVNGSTRRSTFVARICGDGTSSRTTTGTSGCSRASRSCRLTMTGANNGRAYLWNVAFDYPNTFNAVPRNNQKSLLCRHFQLGMSSSYSNLASGLLYQEQEKMIVARGMLEEELMAQNKQISELLPANIQVRGTGKAGGFGGGKSGGKQKQKLGKKVTFKTEAAVYANTLLAQGVVRIDNVLSANLADRVRKYAYELRSASEQEIKQGNIQPIERFADVLLKQNRCDLTIPLGDDVISDALNEVIRESAVGYTISSILSDDAVLYELSCLMSDPGSQRQVMHPDTPFLEGKGPVLYTCFIALQDISLDMGPTTWLPGTHTNDAHQAFMDSEVAKDGASESRKDALIKNHPAVLGTLKKGSCAIFDSRCLHCGTANRSEQSRALFYFSFKSPKVGHPGNPGSIRKSLGAAQVTLKALQDDLEMRSDGKGQPLIDYLSGLMI